MTTAKGIIGAIVLLAVAALFVGCRKSDQDKVEYTGPDGKKIKNVKDIGEGTVTYQVHGGAAIPPKAEQLHREARTKGETGDYPAALALLRQASEIAPEWAYPYYDMAFTYLLQGDSTNALLHYRKVDRLEPGGFFTTKTALWTLEREEKGVFPPGTYLAFVSLESMRPEKKQAIVDQLTAGIPSFAPAWKEKALLTQDTPQRLIFYETALALNPDAETYGLCVLNKAATLNGSGRAAEAKRLVEELIRSDTCTATTKALAKELLKSLGK